MAVKLKLSDPGVGYLIHAALTDIFQVLRGWEQRCQVFNISGLSNDPNLKDPEDSQHRHTDGDSEEAKVGLHVVGTFERPNPHLIQPVRPPIDS
jgi:hypothetical protein